MNALAKHDSWTSALKRTFATGKITSTSALLASTASTLGALWAYKKWQNSIYTLPPSGKTWPFFGNLYDIGEHSLHLDYLRIQKENNLPGMYLLKVGPVDSIIIINDYEIMKDAMETQGDLFQARPPMTLSVVMDFEEDVFNHALPDATWRDAKKWYFMTTTGGQGEMKGAETYISREVANLIDFIDNKRLFNTPVDICDLIQRAEANVCFSLILSRRFDLDDPVLIDWTKKIVAWYVSFADNFLKLELFSPFFCKVFQRERAKEIFQVTDNCREFIREELKKHKATLNPDSPRDFLDLYMINMKGADFKRIVNTTFVLMPDAIDTMSKMMNWVVAYIVFYPEVQRRIQAEIDKCCGRDRPVVYSDHSQLPYTQAVIMEATRVICPLIITGLHTSTEDCDFRGYHLPKGQAMLLNLFGALHDPKIYPNPTQFDPDRFLDENGQLVKGVKIEAWIPFGIGRRKCTGTGLTKKEILVVIGNLFRCYDMEFPEGGIPSMVPEHNVVFRCMPQFKVIIKKRPNNPTS